MYTISTYREDRRSSSRTAGASIVDHSTSLVRLRALVRAGVYAQSNARVNNGGDSDQEKLTFWLQDENDSWRVPLPNWTLEAPCA